MNDAANPRPAEWKNYEDFASGNIENNLAGAFIQKASMTFYPRNSEPV